jgi:hypothetical protein
MEKINVKVLEEYRGHMDPERKYHLVDIETGREPIGNLKKEEIENYANIFHLTLVENLPTEAPEEKRDSLLGRLAEKKEEAAQKHEKQELKRQESEHSTDSHQCDQYMY